MCVGVRLPFYTVVCGFIRISITTFDPKVHGKNEYKRVKNWNLYINEYCSFSVSSFISFICLLPWNFGFGGLCGESRVFP